MKAQVKIVDSPEIFKHIIDRANKGLPLSLRELMQFDPRPVAMLFDKALIKRRKTRLGIIIVPTTRRCRPAHGRQRIIPNDAAGVPDDWTYEEISYLRRACRGGISVVKIADHLGREVRSVHHRAWKMSLKPRAGPEVKIIEATDTSPATGALPRELRRNW